MAPGGDVKPGIIAPNGQIQDDEEGQVEGRGEAPWSTDRGPVAGLLEPAGWVEGGMLFDGDQKVKCGTGV